MEGLNAAGKYCSVHFHQCYLKASNLVLIFASSKASISGSEIGIQRRRPFLYNQIFTRFDIKDDDRFNLNLNLFHNLFNREHFRQSTVPI